jgi:hypothetical protein
MEIIANTVSSNSKTEKYLKNNDNNYTIFQILLA